MTDCLPAYLPALSYHLYRYTHCTASYLLLNTTTMMHHTTLHRTLASSPPHHLSHPPRRITAHITSPRWSTHVDSITFHSAVQPPADLPHPSPPTAFSSPPHVSSPMHVSRLTSLDSCTPLNPDPLRLSLPTPSHTYLQANLPSVLPIQLPASFSYALTY